MEGQNKIILVVLFQAFKSMIIQGDHANKSKTFGKTKQYKYMKLSSQENDGARN